MGARNRKLDREALVKRQRAAVWSRVGKLQRNCDLSRDEAEDIMRYICVQISGQQSTKKLSIRQVEELCKELDARISRHSRSTPKPQPPPADRRSTTRAGRAVYEDLNALTTMPGGRALLELAAALGWTKRGLRDWIRNRMGSVCEGIPWPQTRGQVMKLHEGLEAQLMRRDSSQPPALLQRAERALTLPELSNWEVSFLQSIVDRKGDVTIRVNTRGNNYRSWKTVTKLAEIERTRG